MTDDRPFDPSILNTTELVTAAVQVNPEAHRGLPDEVLIAIIQGEDVELPQRTLNKKRLKIMSYINANWSQVSYQVSCPAKTRDDHACFGCTDTQVTSCTLENSKKFLAD